MLQVHAEHVLGLLLAGHGQLLCQPPGVLLDEQKVIIFEMLLSLYFHKIIQISRRVFQFYIEFSILFKCIKFNQKLRCPTYQFCLDLYVKDDFGKY